MSGGVVRLDYLLRTAVGQQDVIANTRMTVSNNPCEMLRISAKTIPPTATMVDNSTPFALSPAFADATIITNRMVARTPHTVRNAPPIDMFFLSFRGLLATKYATQLIYICQAFLAYPLIFHLQDTLALANAF